MKLEKWALVAEVAGSVAIVATLIVLLTEVRANTDVQRAANRQSIASRVENITLALANNPSLQDRLRNVDAPGNPEPSRIVPFYNAILRNTEEAYLLWQEGALDGDYVERKARSAFTTLDSAYFRDWFTRRQNFFDPGFVEYGKGLLDTMD